MYKGTYTDITATPQAHHARSLRCGITSVIAMIFMVLIACLALGFYATMTTSTKLSQNDQKGARHWWRRSRASGTCACSSRASNLHR
jgi:Tfp pilus assembly protein PilX